MPAAAPPDDRLTPQLLKDLPPAAVIRQRIADISTERSLLRQLLRIAVRREQAAASGKAVDRG